MRIAVADDDPIDPYGPGNHIGGFRGSGDLRFRKQRRPGGGNCTGSCGRMYC